jgi:hypothetical protein
MKHTNGCLAGTWYQVGNYGDYVYPPCTCDNKWRVRKLPEGYWQVRSPHEAGGYLHYAFGSGADAIAAFAGGWPQ